MHTVSKTALFESEACYFERSQRFALNLQRFHTRGSVRKYEKREITDEIIEKLLSAAMSAPSAVNQQSGSLSS
jgi:hypothetical protein